MNKNFFYIIILLSIANIVVCFSYDKHRAYSAFFIHNTANYSQQQITNSYTRNAENLDNNKAKNIVFCEMNIHKSNNNLSKDTYKKNNTMIALHFDETDQNNLDDPKEKMRPILMRQIPMKQILMT